MQSANANFTYPEIIHPVLCSCAHSMLALQSTISSPFLPHEYIVYLQTHHSQHFVQFFWQDVGNIPWTCGNIYGTENL